jgi:hypothetical protein
MRKRFFTHNDFLNVGFYPGFYSSLREEEKNEEMTIFLKLFSELHVYS